jgi:FkbM family methyltransferase
MLATPDLRVSPEMAGLGSKLTRNAASLASDPAMVGEYLAWIFSSAKSGGKPSRNLLDGIQVGGFSSFSEYHSVPVFINAAERRFFEQSRFGEGPILDVGANIGLVSLLLARRFPDRVIHAFEPNPTTFETLEANIARNGANKVLCHRYAVSDADGTVMFDNDPIARGTASISRDGSRHAAEVPAITLDSFVAKHAISSIGLLKIDVEGYETLVFRGAKHVLNEIRPSIYFEVCPDLTERAGFGAADPARMLLDAGYDLRRLTDDGTFTPATIDEIEGIVLENWLATPQ